jgi:hypothetical protein
MRTGDATVAEERPQQRYPRTYRAMWWFQRILAVVGIVLFAMIALGRYLERNELPACDSQRARDTLSDIFKQQNVDATAYDQRRTVSSSDNEVVCVARLTVRGGSHVSVDYRFFRDGEAQRISYTITQVP